MTKIDALRRFLLPCIFPPSAVAATISQPPTIKKRLSSSLREDLINTNRDSTHTSSSSSVTDTKTPTATATLTAPPRPSKSMVISTIFGHRRGHVWFCIQQNRLSTKPYLLLELSIPTQQLVKEMRCGLVRIALESGSDLGSCPLKSVPVWSMYCNGKKLGFAARRKGNDRVRVILKTMQSVSVGAGVLPGKFGSDPGSEEIMYMRANYEHVMGSADSESFHLINPDKGSGQELSVFLIRYSRS